MLGEYDETLVVDWGLAKPISAGRCRRRPGEERLMPISGSGYGTPTVGVVGTLCLHEPRAGTGAVGPGRPGERHLQPGGNPLRDSARASAVSGEDPRRSLPARRAVPVPKPRELRSQVPRGIEAICLKAMAATPEGRYATALDLASDVRRWLADEPVSAYREPLPAREHGVGSRAQATGLGGMVLLVSAVVGLAINDRIVRHEARSSRSAHDRALPRKVCAVEAE